MVDREYVEQYFKSLDNNLRILREFAEISWPEFERSERDQLAAKHALQLALESVKVITDHLIPSDKKTSRAHKAVYSGVIPESFGTELETMVGMRDCLVHKYRTIDVSIIYNVIKNELGLFEDFRTHVKAYMDNTEGAP
jgi:uncharacterized protein YutE (UPF0331/DUF86 family)